MSKISEYLKKRTYWYHKIQLPDGTVTPGFDLDPIWNQIRRVRSNLDYTNKCVLDIASFDGLFAFEAEKLGASQVIATDCMYKSFGNFLFCREVLDSNVIPYFNVSPYNLTERLDVYFQERYDEDNDDRRFDVVQHFGLLYHLRDPLLSLLQARSMLKDNGKLVIETDYVMGSDESKLVFNGIPNSVRVRDNYSVWWAPTKRCLIEMLEASFFEVELGSMSEISFDVPVNKDGSKLKERGVLDCRSDATIGRICLVAIARNPENCDQMLHAELRRHYRNPGFNPGLQ